MHASATTSTTTRVIQDLLDAIERLAVELVDPLEIRRRQQLRRFGNRFFVEIPLEIEQLGRFDRDFEIGSVEPQRDRERDVTELVNRWLDWSLVRDDGLRGLGRRRALQHEREDRGGGQRGETGDDQAPTQTLPPGLRDLVTDG